ncbi:hypothetical protein J2Z31_000428 [Sinorhizobium kostiense]|uniref:Uncharacterized protein n=1 Tax=Sinorhizobium kostiense TaxID=76747 RepID=A0ABS4QTE6_9HYPH|nr:hypothetical protein [Sinorhizobium kostiense]MBP2233938.1 hypothetical protein [Sinorhizobium kostiense]
MGIVTLVLTVCLVSAPEKCREEIVQLQGAGSLTQCMHQSLFYVAEWSEHHPALRVKKWRCKPAEIDRLI